MSIPATLENVWECIRKSNANLWTSVDKTDGLIFANPSITIQTNLSQTRVIVMIDEKNICPKNKKVAKKIINSIITALEEQFEIEEVESQLQYRRIWLKTKK